MAKTRPRRGRPRSKAGNAEALAKLFGASSDVAQRAVSALFEPLCETTPGGSPTDSPVRTCSALPAGPVNAHAPCFGLDGHTHWLGLASLSAAYSKARPGGDPARLLFAAQSYYVLVVRMLVDRVVAAAHGHDTLPPGTCHAASNGDSTVRGEDPVSGRFCFDSDVVGPRNADPFGWIAHSSSGALDGLFARLAEAMHGCDFPSLFETAQAGGDLFKGLYQAIFPRRFRHALGEYYTPDWLAEHVLDQAGYHGEPGVRLLDPACGSGTFLVQAIRRLRDRWAQIHGSRTTDREGLRRSILSAVVGVDINPLAAITARANYLMALCDLLPESRRVEPSVHLADSILAGADEANALGGPFDFVVGNPPWIAWDDLPSSYREASKPLWQRYGLFSLSGAEARHGGGKKDLSMLMIYAAADRYLKPDGRLAMIITQTVFQTRGAGDGFRRFRLGTQGPWLRVSAVDDLADMRPFPGAANWTATITLEKGRPTEYPVPYTRWLADGRRERLEAAPIDPAAPSSPWLVRPPGWGSCDASQIGPSAYEAHLGANTGGANAVYWVSPVHDAEAASGPGLIRIRNIAAGGKTPADTVDHLVEADLLYPLLRWADVDRFSAQPRALVLVVQDAQSRRGIDEELMIRRYPNAYAYLLRFRDHLTHRAAYRRYQSRAAFYSMYDIGPYTFAPWKVVWRRMDRRINAAVIEPVVDARWGTRPVVPQETCVLIAADSCDEAHYLSAVLNSSVVNSLVASHSVRGGKGFGSPGMLQYLSLQRYRPHDEWHAALALASREAHRRKRLGENVEDQQAAIDRLVAQLRGFL